MACEILRANIALKRLTLPTLAHTSARNVQNLDPWSPVELKPAMQLYKSQMRFSNQQVIIFQNIWREHPFKSAKTKMIYVYERMAKLPHASALASLHPHELSGDIPWQQAVVASCRSRHNARPKQFTWSTGTPVLI